MKVLFLSILVAVSVSQTAAQSCPPGVPVFQCLVDPCTGATCPNIPTATCRADYCGGCIARWYVSSGFEVTNNCSSVLPPCPPSSDGGETTACVQACTGDSSCSPGQTCCQRSSCGTACINPDPCALILCDIPICDGGVAPIYDNSSCCPYCPSPCATVTCITPVCANGVQPTIPEGECCPLCPAMTNGTENASCPTPPPGSIGTCAISCTSDDSCPGSQLCCSNGCGWSCVEPVTAMCTGHDGRTYRPGQTFMAADGCNNCTCTSTGLAICTLRACPQGCTDSAGNRHAIGSNFTAPDGCNHCVCTRGGFIACTEIYCPPQNCPSRLPDGCVPRTDGFCPPCPLGLLCCSGCCVSPNITCLDSNGNQRQVNESFTAADGCNTCTCTSTGLVACTRRACPPDTCSLPAETGVCEAYFPSYYFNSRTGICERFIYGGCGGNENRFSTPAECYRRCNSSSQCIQPTYPDESEQLCLVVVRRWAFNATSGRCGEIAYSPCGQESEGFNVYDSEGECNRTCVRAEEICPNGEPIVRCFSDPCSINSCPGQPEATCEANYCGGCHAYFFDASGNNVTDQCSTAVLPTPMEATVCPTISNGTGGLCAELCTTDTSCSDEEICCPNGCGRSCVEPTRIPYYEIPRQCPDTGDGDLTTGSCVFTNNSCLTADDCDADGELCCQSGCGRRCTASVVPSQPCFAVADEFIVFSGRLPPGRYVPSCDAVNGTFVPVQCNPSTGFCWCVNTRTGQPNSGLYARGVHPNCTTCNYNGAVHYSGDSFPSSDGCNTCQCSDSGLVLCTLRACVDTCSLPADPGPCRGAFPAYHYDRSEGACRPFVYGGCQGNDNKFQTIGDCLRRCDPDNQCLRPSGICIDTFNSSIDSGHYTFNATSGQCERFPSGCTFLPIFSNLMDCQSNCNPGSAPDMCATVRCAQPNCTRDRWITNPGECCPRCQPPDSVNCRDDQFRCNDTSCISSDWVCDGLRDCANGQDESERLCRRNRTCTGHMCGDGVCISSDYVCDNFLDCRDASDEDNCTATTFDNTFYPDQLPTRCPNSTGLIGNCAEECTSDNPCRDDAQMCCSNGCGHSCVVGVTVAPLCPALARQQFGGIGAFVPECERDGSFSTSQCWGSTGYCWCVDTVSGRPISEGVRGEPQCEGCMVDGDVYPHGERFTAEDGCNTCYCSNTGVVVCTREACAPVSCMVLDREIPHGEKLDDACSNCTCRSGQLNCTRKVCATVGAITQQPSTRVTMDYGGDLKEITPTDDHKENFQREIMKTLLTRYKDTLGLTQEQITNIEVEDKGDIAITVELTESKNTSGANVTLLVGQMEQDYQSSALVIRYNRAVLEPSGDFQVDDQSAGGSAFPWWGILIAVVGAAVLVAAIAVAVMAVLLKGKAARHTVAESNDYTKVTFKTEEGDLDLKVDFGED